MSASALIRAGTAAAVVLPVLAGATRAEAAECTAVTLNKTCTIIIDRKAPITPLPVRLRPDAKVIIQVNHGPLEKIVFDATVADTVSADPLAAIFAAFTTPLKSLVTSVSVATGPRTAVNVNPVTDRRSALEKSLDEIIAEQDGVQSDLEKVEGKIKGVAKKLQDFQQRATWTVPEFVAFRDWFQCTTRGTLGEESLGSCQGSEKVALETLPVGRIKATDARIKAVLEQFVAASSPASEIIEKMDGVVARQRTLHSSAEALSAGQKGLLDVATLFDKLLPSKVSPIAVYEIGGFESRVTRTAAIKIAVQDLTTKAEKPLTTVSVGWGAPRWEVSAGLVISTLRNRTFQNAPIIEDGHPKLDPAGKVSTQIIETTSRPIVVPFALAHFRLFEGVPAGASQRLALLWTFGIGVNPHSGSADFATGPTFSYRGLMVSPMLHRLRDLRLTNGLKTGQELGSAPPALSTERHWVGKLGVGISYRIPFN